MFGADHKCINIRAYRVVNITTIVLLNTSTLLTRTIDTQAITSISENLSTCCLDCCRGQPLLSTDNLDKLMGYALKELENLFSTR